MKTNFGKKLIYSISALALLILVNPVSAAYNFAEQSGLQKTGSTAGYASTTSNTIEGLIGNIILTLLSFVGVLFLVLIIFGAITWMTAEGNDEKVKKATTIIKNSVIGLVITLSAYAISYFLISFFWE